MHFLPIIGARRPTQKPKPDELKQKLATGKQKALINCFAIQVVF